jgi:hypothetical protein
MTVKFKIDFVIDAETLFGVIAKFLPLEALHVEEVVERHAPTRAMPKLAAQAVAKPMQRTMQRAPRGVGNATNINEGISGVITRLLADGEPHRYRDLKRAVAEAGYAGSGIGSRLKRLQELAVIVSVGPGLWRSAPKKDR